MNSLKRLISAGFLVGLACLGVAAMSTVFHAFRIPFVLVLAGLVIVSISMLALLILQIRARHNPKRTRESFGVIMLDILFSLVELLPW